MGYSTRDDLEQRVDAEKIKRWAYHKGNTEPDTEILQASSDWADEEINHALTNLYAAYLPFTAATLPTIIKNIAVAFRIFWLASRFDDCSESYKFAYQEARKRLTAIATGEEALIAPDGSNLLDPTPNQPEIDGDYAQSTTSGQTPIFTRSELETLMLR